MERFLRAARSNAALARLRGKAENSLNGAAIRILAVCESFKGVLSRQALFIDGLKGEIGGVNFLLRKVTALHI